MTFLKFAGKQLFKPEMSPFTIGGIVACVCADPTQMLPWIFTFLCFVSLKRRNLYALGAACLFAIVAAVLLSVERS